MATFRAALMQLSNLTVSGIRKNYDLDELPERLETAQLPALLVMPIELDRRLLFQRREDGLQTAAFSGAAKTISYRVTHQLLHAPLGTGLGLRSHLPRMVELIDNYIATISADVTLGDSLLSPVRLNVEPGIFPFAGGEFYGCAFRHSWLLEA